jgi:hypothetical protein
MQIKLFTLCLTILMYSTVAHAEYDVNDLKKLFTDERQRAQIDAARSGTNVGAGLKKTNKVKVLGYMKRSSGKSVVWVNNKNTLEDSAIDDIRVHKDNLGKNNKVTVSVDGKFKRLRPGESWNKETGEVVENQ